MILEGNDMRLHAQSSLYLFTRNKLASRPNFGLDTFISDQYILYLRLRAWVTLCVPRMRVVCVVLCVVCCEREVLRGC